MLGCALVLSAAKVCAQAPESGFGAARVFPPISLDVYLESGEGARLTGTALVTLRRLDGQIFVQGTAKNGYLRLNEVPATAYRVEVVAAGFSKAVREVDASVQVGIMKVTIQLTSSEEAVEIVTDADLAALPPKAIRATGKAIEALRTNKLPEAKSQLDVASRLAPQSVEVNYLLGVYWQQMKDRAQAEACWVKALGFYPQHYRSLLSLSQALIGEDKVSEAIPYLERAVRVEPSAWRAHAVLAEAELKKGSPEQAIQEAERALELGHGKAGVVRPVLAGALILHGDRDQANSILQQHLREYPGDNNAKKMQAMLQTPSAAEGASEESSKEIPAPSVGGTVADALPSNWLPADIDEKTTSVVSDAACSMEDVLKNTGKRIQEFVSNVDRFAAMESIQHESINKWGMPSAPMTLKFDYLVSVQELKGGSLDVEEYRTHMGGLRQFPDGIATNGLPAMVLILHPQNTPNFDFNCEGLVRWNGSLAWQVHFRQRADRPNTIRTYRFGMQGPAYRVDLKGRAWIAADTYQIVRMETQMISPLPQIKLAADYTAIEYGPVHFKNRNLDMWLPQTAEVFADWRGKRFHRRHSFSKYMLFSVDEKVKIAVPKEADEAQVKSDGGAQRPNP